jgi:hypothetical protein
MIKVMNSNNGMYAICDTAEEALALLNAKAAATAAITGKQYLETIARQAAHEGLPQRKRRGRPRKQAPVAPPAEDAPASRQPVIGEVSE